MVTFHLECGRVTTIFYEPDGLLLQSSLLPVNLLHKTHLLAFSLNYLGTGSIMVHVALGGEPGCVIAFQEGVYEVTEVVLHGTDSPVAEVSGISLPVGWMTYAPVPDTPIEYRYSLLGQPGGGEDADVRGELVATVRGTPSSLEVCTKAGITSRPVPDSVSIPAMRGECVPSPAASGPREAADEPDDYTRRNGLMRNSRTYPPRQ